MFFVIDKLPNPLQGNGVLLVPDFFRLQVTGNAESFTFCLPKDSTFRVQPSLALSWKLTDRNYIELTNVLAAFMTGSDKGFANVS